MKTLLPTFTALILLAYNSFPQAPDTLWTRTFGGGENEYGLSVQQTNDSGYIITGYTASFGAGLNDIILIKTDESGNEDWIKYFGGSENDYGVSVQQTNDNGFIVGGRTNSFGAGDYDIYLIKTNSAGDTMWTRTMGGTGYEYCSSVQQTSDGGFILAGGTESFGLGSVDIWLIKTNQNGDTLWTKTFGGTNNDGASYVEQTSDSGYIITGITHSFGEVWGDVWLLKTDESGNEVWNKTYGGMSLDIGAEVRQTIDSGFIIIGNTGSFGLGSSDIWLIKTNQNGDTLWTKTFGSTDIDQGSSVYQTADTGYVLLGYTPSAGAGGNDFWLIKVEQDGNEEWNGTYGGIDFEQGYSVGLTSDGGYIMIGNTRSFGMGQYDVWLVKSRPDSPVEVTRYNETVSQYFLSQNYPNPFNPLTKIKYSIPNSSNVIIKVFDILGNEVETLINEEKPVGTYVINWYAENLPSGVYFYQLKTESYVETRKMILIK